MPISIPGQRKVGIAFVAALLLFAMFAGQGLNARPAEAATFTYYSPSDICEPGELTINAEVGDFVKIYMPSSSCYYDALGPWSGLWTTNSDWDLNGTFLQVTITQAGTAMTYWGPGPMNYPATIVAPATVPGAPTGVSAVAGNTQATVSFSAPASNGGAAITSYTVTASSGETATGASSPLTVTGLMNGLGYNFTVTATNSAGTSTASEPSNVVVPATVPSVPTTPFAIAGNAQAVVHFTPPFDIGGSAITGYTVTSSPGDISVSGATSPLTVTGLTNGTAYTFTVTATNLMGTGNPSPSSGAVKPIGAPGAPQNVSAVGGHTQATVSFDAPASNGGAAITGYTVTANPGGSTGTGASSPITVTGLTNGTAYTFTVTATNSAGTSLPSAPATATPMTVPGAPTSVSVVAGNGEATVSFTAPADDDGGYIWLYTATASPDGKSVNVFDVAGPITITGLANGTEYTFTVTARNNAGTGEPSAPSTAVTPMTVAGVPTSVTATSGNGQATITFDDPKDDGGSAITGYNVTASPFLCERLGASRPWPTGVSATRGPLTWRLGDVCPHPSVSWRREAPRSSQ